MLVQNVRCISLGVLEKPAGEFQGKPTNAYFALDFVIVNENASRRSYLNSPELKSSALKYCSNWGAPFVISGDVDSRGKLSVTAISKDTENPDFENF